MARLLDVLTPIGAQALAWRWTCGGYEMILWSRICIRWCRHIRGIDICIHHLWSWRTLSSFYMWTSRPWLLFAFLRFFLFDCVFALRYVIGFFGFDISVYQGGAAREHCLPKRFGKVGKRWISWLELCDAPSVPCTRYEYSFRSQVYRKSDFLLCSFHRSRRSKSLQARVPSWSPWLLAEYIRSSRPLFLSWLPP